MDDAEESAQDDGAETAGAALPSLVGGDDRSPASVHDETAADRGGTGHCAEPQPPQSPSSSQEQRAEQEEVFDNDRPQHVGRMIDLGMDVQIMRQMIEKGHQNTLRDINRSKRKHERPIARIQAGRYHDMQLTLLADHEKKIAAA